MKNFFTGSTVAGLIIGAIIGAVIMLIIAPEQLSNTNTASVNKHIITAERLQSDKETQAYALGGSIAQSINNILLQQNKLGVSLNKELVISGIQMGLTDTLILTKEEIATATKQLSEQLASLSEAKRAELNKELEIAKIENLAKEKQFLAENAKKSNIITTDSGLQYEILVDGAGAKPSAKDTVTVHYTGTLLDGTVFDSSVQRDEPATFKLNQVVPGWTEGVQLMNEGAKYKFYIPAKLGYGSSGAPGTIPPNSVLIFEIELISIKASEIKKE